MWFELPCVAAVRQRELRVSGEETKWRNLLWFAATFLVLWNVQRESPAINLNSELCLVQRLLLWRRGSVVSSRWVHVEAGDMLARFNVNNFDVQAASRCIWGEPRDNGLLSSFYYRRYSYSKDRFYMKYFRRKVRDNYCKTRGELLLTSAHVCRRKQQSSFYKQSLEGARACGAFLTLLSLIKITLPLLHLRALEMKRRSLPPRSEPVSSRSRSS